MRLPQEPDFPVVPASRPTRDLLLAQALDACITAERRLPGSSQEIIARQPASARADLQRLLGVAGWLDAAGSNASMSTEFRVAARARLMRRIGGDVSRVPAEADPPAAMGQPASIRVYLRQANREGQLAVRKTFWEWLRSWSLGLWPSVRG